MPRIKFLPIRGQSFYCDGRLSIGVHINRNNIATLIDSGIDKDTAKEVQKTLKSANATLGAIINTHSHADHCGGNHYLQTHYPDVKIFATKYERAFIETPVMEPTCFCAGAKAFKELCNKHLQAEPSNVTDVIHPYQDQSINIHDSEFKIVTLPGHTPGMIGVISPDGILYCGDAIFGEETFNKHGILFYTDIEDTLASFTKLANLEIEGCVFYHGGLINGIKDTTIKHAQRIRETETAILDIITSASHSLDTATQAYMRKFLIPENVMQFTLTRTVVQAYLAHLQQQNKIELSMHQHLLTFKGTTATPVCQTDDDDDCDRHDKQKQPTL